MQTWLHACILATISGLSLPVGAILGILLSPVQDIVCCAWLAFGAGALLFAVTVELYGHALRELETGRAGIYEMLGTIAGAFVGALFYLTVNRWLEDSVEEPSEDIEHNDVESDAQSFVGNLGPSETTPFLPKHRGPVNSALAEERRRWEQISKGGLANREDSFTQPNASFTRYPSFSRNANASFASYAFSEASFKSRGRDKFVNMSLMSVCSGSQQAPSRKSPASIAESVKEADPELAKRGNQVAFGLFLGLLVDGVPEGILMGFLAAEGHLSEVLIISLLVANFPEAFSSASLMAQGGVSTVNIVGMWTGLCVMVGALAGGACYALMHFFPSYPAGDLPHGLLILVAVVEGVTGGAMISCIATVMLPEAFMRAGGRAVPLLASSGFLCTAGFLVAVTLKAFEHYYYAHHL